MGRDTIAGDGVISCSSVTTWVTSVIALSTTAVEVEADALWLELVVASIL